MSRPPYDPTGRTRHAPKIAIVRDRARVMHGEPLCQAPNAPGSTTTVDVYINCEACLKILSEEG